MCPSIDLLSLLFRTAFLSRVGAVISYPSDKHKLCRFTIDSRKYPYLRLLFYLNPSQKLYFCSVSYILRFKALRYEQNIPTRLKTREDHVRDITSTIFF